MWPWIKRWRDWAMHDLWPLHRIGPQPQALHYRYEKAGLTLENQPIPWNAEAVLVEARVRPGAGKPRKGDFHLRLAGTTSIPAESLRPDDAEDFCRLFFRLSVPPQNTTAEVLWGHRSLGQMTLPILGQEEFRKRLSLQMPTLNVRLGGQTVACQTYVSTQCEGLLASALLTSPTSLVPILDLGLQVEFLSVRSGQAQRVPVQFTSSQLKNRQALITVALRKPRRIGPWQVTWLLGDSPLASQRVKGISKQHFLRSLRISETRFVWQTLKGEVRLARQLPPREEVARVGPCFLVCSREEGMAGLCSLQVLAQVAGALGAPVLREQEVLITDGPTPFAPGTLDVADMTDVTGFELRLKNQVLGILPLAPAPTATFSNEGGFKPPPEFTWTPAAEDQLNERLSRLLDPKF